MGKRSKNWINGLGGKSNGKYIMRSKFAKHVKNSTRFVAILLIYYIFLFYMVKATAVVVVWSWDLPSYINELCHGLATVFTIITIILYGPPTRDGKN